jgi:hypothetical protein
LCISQLATGVGIGLTASSSGVGPIHSRLETCCAALSNSRAVATESASSSCGPLPSACAASLKPKAKISRPGELRLRASASARQRAAICAEVSPLTPRL